MQELSILGYIILFTFIGSILSLLGGILLLLKENLALKISHFLAAFAAGTLLGTVFFDLLPEAVEQAEKGKGNIDVFFWVLVGILGFFILERFIHWFHHHQHDENEEVVKPTVPLVILGDSVHNFIDGVVIAASFLVSIPLGIVTALAVAVHEIPQEVGDFGILLHNGLKRKKVLAVNFISALSSVAGSIFVLWIGNQIEAILPVFLAITAGFFIYISASDLIPEIHHENRRGFALFETSLMILGISTIWIFITILDTLGAPV